MDIEQALQKTLKATDPGPEFTKAVLQRVALPRGPLASPAHRRSWRIPVSLAASTLIGLLGLQLHNHLEQKAQAEQAREQLVLALTIVSNELTQLQQKISPN